MKSKFYIIGLALAVLLSLSLFEPASAQADTVGAAQGMQLSPTTVDLSAARGKTYNITINVMNITNSDMLYTSSVADFSAADETGSPKITIDSNLPTTSSIKNWVSVDSQFNLKSQTSKTLIAKITIPNDAEPGGHYGVLRFSGSAPQVENTGVGLSASAGVLVLIRVEGDTIEKAETASFFTAKDGKQTSFFESSPIAFTTRVKNTGNVHIQPFGNIEISDMFGSVVKTLAVNEPKSNVLPNSIRKFESKTNNIWMFGKYTANLSIGYGTTGQAITNTITFWVIPYKIILAGLFIIATILYILSKLLKAYNKRIIQKSKNEETATKKKHNSKKS